MGGKFEEMYMNHTSYLKKKEINREDYKKGRFQRTRDGYNSTGSTGSGKLLTMSSQMQSEIYTDCGMSRD